MDRYRVKLTFTQPLLGTAPKDRDVYAAYIASKAELTDEQLAEELESIEHVEEKGWTGFHCDENGPHLLDYMVKGYFKEACGALWRVKGTKSSKLRAYKKIINGLVFPEPRKIYIKADGESDVLERPLRASTPQGERVALARSDTAPKGSSIEFELVVLGVVSEALLREWLDYGQYSGMGQWRSGGWGRFEYTLEKVQ